MGSLRFSASAENDLLEAWLYVAEDSLDAAETGQSRKPWSVPYYYFVSFLQALRYFNMINIDLI